MITGDPVLVEPHLGGVPTPDVDHVMVEREQTGVGPVVEGQVVAAKRDGRADSPVAQALIEQGQGVEPGLHRRGQALGGVNVESQGEGADWGGMSDGHVMSEPAICQRNVSLT